MNDKTRWIVREHEDRFIYEMTVPKGQLSFLVFKLKYEDQVRLHDRVKLIMGW